MKSLEEDYKKVFGKYAIPETLKKLMEFENQYGSETFSECFYLWTDTDNRTPDAGQFSLDDEYFERLLEFANADGTGGKYAFWVNHIEMSLEDAPIIYLGSEGYITVCSKNIRDLIRLLSFGPECMDGSFCKEIDGLGYLSHATEFQKWMQTELKLEPIGQSYENMDEDTIYELISEEEVKVEQILNDAKKLYAEPFRAWMNSLTPQYDVFDNYC